MLEELQPILVAVLVGLSVYLFLIALLPKRMLIQSTHYMRHVLDQLAQQKQDGREEDGGEFIGRQKRSGGLMARLFFMMPGSKLAYPMMLKAGMGEQAGIFFTQCLAVFCIALYLFAKSFPANLLLAPAAAYGFGYFLIRRSINRRNAAFLTHFPDALDMIVRSVRSGYPMNSAVRMVADNMQPPVSTEFKQVADEIAYGSTLIDSLQRLSSRIDEPDVHFFVVVLTVQQDIGGNLSEILGNLAGIIRKRKHLRMKIKALASEGRATAWVLGSLPVGEALLIFAFSPSHLAPLLYTSLGHTVLAGTALLMALGAFIVSRMVNIRV